MSLKIFSVNAKDGSVPIQDIKEDISRQGIGCTFAIDKGMNQAMERNKHDWVCEAVFSPGELEDPDLPSIRQSSLQSGGVSNIDAVRRFLYLLHKEASVFSGDEAGAADRVPDFLVTTVNVDNPASPVALAIIRNIKGRMIMSVTDFADIREADKDKRRLPGKWKVFGIRCLKQH